jgi:ADP-heptose:LPS heptosyltransferase
MAKQVKITDSKRILFVHQFLAMGDAVLLSPVYKTLKDNIKGVEISVLTNQYSVPFVEAIPYVDHVYSMESFFREGLSRMERFLRLCMFFIKYHFDTIVLRSDRRLPQRAFNLASKICLLKTVSIGSYLEEEITESRHIVETYFKILERMGFRIEERGRLYLNLPDSALKEAKTFLGGEKTERLAGIAPVSNIKVKNWTPEKTAELVNRFKEMSYDVVLFCADKEFSKIVSDLTGNNLITIVERINFSSLMGIIAICNIFVGVDTGPTHVASALGVPTIGLYGPTSCSIAGPYSRKSLCIQSSVACPYYNPLALFSPKERPQECYLDSNCKLSTINCVDTITVDDVVKAIYRVVR